MNESRTTNNDERHMRHALRLAERGLGNAWPNPAVGAVIVKEDRIVGRGWTARGGRPHAETAALAQAGANARGATLYVTLEPCAHHGQTPPCTDSIIQAGIARVVVACTDPNPKVSGEGIKQLREAGVEVVESCCEAEAERLNEGFFSVIERKRPFVTLKLATSLDGKIATADRKSKWITSAESRRHGHYLRATHDAILTGIGTVLADNPKLSCRLNGREKDSPQRVVLDSQLRTPPDASVLPAWIFASEAMKDKTMPNVRLFFAPSDGTRLSLFSILGTLAAEGVTRLLVETGNLVAGEFVKKNLADRIYWFRAPVVIGDDGLDALGGHELPILQSPNYRLTGTRTIGEDVLEIYDSTIYE